MEWKNEVNENQKRGTEAVGSEINENPERGTEAVGSEEALDKKEKEGEQIREFGQLTLEDSGNRSRIHLLTIIGEIEGHENLSANTKTTKYEHVLPQLAALEESPEIDGLLILLNTVGGDVEAGLAIAEMIASLSKPTVSLVLGGGHSIGVPLAVAADYSFIVETGTMLLHPVRMNGTILGVPQTYDYFKRIQDRITGFISSHSRISQERLEELMMETGKMTKDMGTILVGKEAVDEGLIDSLGGIREALEYLRSRLKDTGYE
ncbi:MAG: ATP-dependent Clp protease proteolytic subunit [Clostridiales bacterium]|nr:ATP-dependent Clp protease proteolytic subunit [Clostridiales bacterium]